MNPVFVLLLSLVWTDVLAMPNTWLRYQKKLYLELIDSISWIDAADLCHSYEPAGHLANIKTAAENSFVSTLGTGADRLWIGISFTSSGHWVDWQGNTIDYVNWATGQPDNPQVSDGVLFNIDGATGKWGNTLPTSGYLAVCERDITPNDVTLTKLTSSDGTETPTFTRHADRRLDCAAFCVEQNDCTCIGYDSVSKTCSGYLWQPELLPNIDYFCFKDIQSTPPSE